MNPSTRRASDRDAYSLRGLTLIEVLAVVSLCALAAGLAATGLSAATSRAAIEQAVSDAMALDRVARRLAPTSGPLLLTAAHSGRSMTLRDPSGALLSERAMPAGVRCLIDTGTPEVRFDRSGRCPDYHLQVSDRRGKRRGWMVNGATGWSTPDGAQR